MASPMSHASSANFPGFPEGLGLEDPLWAGPWSQESMGTDFNSMHVLNAYQQADVAAKHAASLAQWVQYLGGTLVRLQGKVTELEDWKRNALEDVRKLRDEHKMLRRHVLGEEAEDRPSTALRSKTMPSLVSPGSDSSFSAGKVASAPPGLEPPEEVAQMPRQGTTTDGFFISSTMSSGSIGFVDPDGQLEGVHLSTVTVHGMECECVEWRIGQLSAKLRGCMGRALVSSPFSAANLEDVRLMVCPDGKETTKGPRSKRQKELYAKKVAEGPLDGCLKLKVPDCPPGLVLQYFLKVGNSRRGPFLHNFSESTVSGCDDFGVDWLKQLEPDNSLTVCVEIVKEMQVIVAGEGKQ